jgi:hypothetical protein
VLPTFTRDARAAGLPGLHVSGSRLVDANGNTVRLHGVDYSGTEYACMGGYGIFDGNTPTQSYVNNLLAEHINAIRIPLNEDCWLGINGVAAAYAGANYQGGIKSWVNLLISNNIYPILALFWNAPGSTQATGQEPMPDADHSPTFWQQVAGAFAGQPQVLFDLYNEPYPGSWSCWLNGGSACSGDVPFAAAGMQTLVNSVRGAGATNVLMLGCLDYSNTCNGYGSSWWQSKPSDPQNNLAASVHVYLGNPCTTDACWNSEWLPIMQQGNPVIDGEWGAYDYNGASYSQSFGTDLLNWMDANGGSGYLAWTWNNWNTWSGSAAEPLIQADDGSVLSTWGSYVQSQYAQRFSGSSPTPTPIGSVSTPTPSSTPTATSTKTATPTPTRTPTPASTPTGTVTASPSPTNTPAATPTRAPTATPVATPTSGGSSSTMAVFTNGAIGSGFSDGSFAYSSRNPCDTSMYTSAPCSYAIAYNAWGGVNFSVNSGGMATSGYSTLQYKLNPSGQPITDFGALLTDSSGAVINEAALANNNVTALSGGWYQVTLPLSQLNPSNVMISTIQLKNEMDASMATVHYDDVYLMGTATPSPTATSTPTKTPVPPTATPTKTPVSPTATPTNPSSTVTFSGTSASPTSVLPRQYEILTGNLQFNQSMTGVTVTYHVLNSAGSVVYTYSWTGQWFSANTAKSFRVNWRIPSSEPPGVYTFKIMVTNGGSTVYGTDNSAGSFSVM